LDFGVVAGVAKSWFGTWYALVGKLRGPRLGRAWTRQPWSA